MSRKILFFILVGVLILLTIEVAFITFNKQKPSSNINPITEQTNQVDIISDIHGINISSFTKTNVINILNQRSFFAPNPTINYDSNSAQPKVTITKVIFHLTNKPQQYGKMQGDLAINGKKQFVTYMAFGESVKPSTQTADIYLFVAPEYMQNQNIHDIQADFTVDLLYAVYSMTDGNFFAPGVDKALPFIQLYNQQELFTIEKS